MPRPTTRQPAPKPDKALYSDFLAALIRVRDLGETVTVHDVTISWPKQQPSSYAVRVESRRTVRCPWTGELSWAYGVGGGSILNIKRTATALAFALEADRALRARLLAEGKPGILANPDTRAQAAA